MERWFATVVALIDVESQDIATGHPAARSLAFVRYFRANRAPRAALTSVPICSVTGLMSLTRKVTGEHPLRKQYDIVESSSINNLAHVLPDYRLGTDFYLVNRFVHTLSTQRSSAKGGQPATDSEEEEGEFEPHFELFNVEEVEDKKPKTEAKQISFEDLLGSSSEPVFERVFDPIQEEEEEESAEEEETEVEETVFSPVFEMEASEEIEEEEKAIPNFEFDKEISINEAFAKTITFGLNDRIAFEKQLFAGSSEDLNRVVSQLSTFDTFEEAQNFIEDMVKPDYDNWEGKEEYVTRFMEIVEKKFA